MSPYLKRLDEKLPFAADAQARGEIMARRAGYLARIGNFEQARILITSLRSEFGDGHSARVTILIIIAEALVFHYEKLNVSALDRIARAQVLSRLVRDLELQANSSAWRAHFEFDHSKFPDMFRSLQDALDSASTEDHDAHARISNVICKMALLCGESALARQHFTLGREHALKESDQASVEAMQHNKAAFRLSRLRAAMAMDSVDPIELKETRIEIASAKSLQNISGVLAFPHYVDLCEARILVVEERYLEASQSLERIKGLGPFPIGSLNGNFLDLEILFCRSQLEGFDGSIDVFKIDTQFDISNLDVDERLIVVWMRYKLCCWSNKFGEIDIAKSVYETALIEYRDFIDRMKVGLMQLKRR